VPGCLAIDGDRAAFFDGERVIALNRKTGGVLWRSEVLGKRSPVPVYFSPSLVLYEDLVLFSGADPDTKPYHADNGKTMYAFSADTGKTLWKQPHPPSGYRSAEDILLVNGLVWTADIFNSKEFRTEQTGTVWGRDPHTGQVKVKFMPDVDTHWFHHRCYRAKATENYLLTSRTGIEFVDIRNQHWTCHHWVRGACLYGIMPANLRLGVFGQIESIWPVHGSVLIRSNDAGKAELWCVAGRRTCSVQPVCWTTCGGIDPTGCSAACGNPGREATIRAGDLRLRADLWSSMRTECAALVANPNTIAGRRPWNICCMLRTSNPRS